MTVAEVRVRAGTNRRTFPELRGAAFPPFRRCDPPQKVRERPEAPARVLRDTAASHEDVAVEAETDTIPPRDSGPKHTFAAAKAAGATTYVASVVSSPPSPSRYVAQSGSNVTTCRTQPPQEKAAAGASTAQAPAGTAVRTGRHWYCATTQGVPTCGPWT